MSLRPLDTTAEALRAQRSAFGRLTPEARVRAALEMSEWLRDVRLSGLRSCHPRASKRELVAYFVAQVHGVRLDAGG